MIQHLGRMMSCPTLIISKALLEEQEAMKGTTITSFRFRLLLPLLHPPVKNWRSMRPQMQVTTINMVALAKT